MSDNAEKLSGKVGLDTTDFKTGLAGMNRELRVIESGFRASAAGLGDWAQNASGLEMRIKALTNSIDIQKQKVAAVRSEYERVAAEKGENSRAAQDLEIKLNKETETLGKMENELGQTESALTGMKEGTEESGEAAEEAGNKWDGLKSVLGGVGAVAKATVGVLLGLVASVAAVAAAVGGLVFSSAAAAGELTDLSVKTGISTTSLQEMKYIGDQVGVSLDTIASSQARLTRSMASAQAGTGDAAKAFEELGVAVANADGSLRSQQDVMADTLTALSNIENPAERDALAMSIFGRSAMELNPLIGLSADEMARMTEEAHKLGAVMSEEDVAALEQFDDTMASLKNGLQGTLGTLAAALLPGFQMLFGSLGGYLETFSGIINTFSQGGSVQSLADGMGALVGQIAGDIAAQAPQLMETGLNIIKGILKSILAALPSLLTAATSILSSLVNFIVEALPIIIPMGVEVLMTLINAILTNLPMLIEAGLQAIIQLALGLSQALPTLIPAIVQAVITIVNVLVENVPMLVDAALQLILGLATGLVAAIPILIPAIPKILQAIVTALIAALPMIGTAAVQLIMTLLRGIIGALPELGKAAVEIVDVLVRGVANLGKTLLAVGKSIVLGVWEGIKAQKDWFYKQITDFFTGIVDSVKDALGISSPSKVFKLIGINTIKGFGMGAQDEFRSIERQLTMAFRGLSGIPAMAGAGGNVSNQSESFEFFAPVVFQGSPSPNSLGAAIKAKRF